MMPMQTKRKSPRTLFEYFFTIMIGAFVIIYALSWVVRQNPSLSANPWIYAGVLILFDIAVTAGVYTLIRKGVFLPKTSKSGIILVIQQIFYIGGVIIYNMAGLTHTDFRETLLLLYLMVTWLIFPLTYYTETEPTDRARTRYNAVFILEIVIACLILYLALDGYLTF